MCILCVEIQKGMTAKEISRAYLEMDIDYEHQSDVLSEVMKHSDVMEVLKEMKKQQNESDNSRTS